MANPAYQDGSLLKQPKEPKQPRQRSPKRGKGLAPESPKQAEKNKLWNFIRFCFLICQLKTLGHYQCMGCGQPYDDASKLQLNHEKRRSRGGEYTPKNAELLGTGPGTCQCHERADGNLLQWSEGRAS